MTQDTMKKKQENKNQASPLAIVGIGCLFPKAGNVNEYWSNIREGVDAITDIPDSHWNPEDYFDANQKTPDMTYGRRGGFIDPVDFNPLQYGMSPNNIEATDTTQLLGMVVARQALLDAGYSTGKDAGDGKEFDRDRTSVIMGVTGTLELVIPLGARLGHPIWRDALAEAGVDPETAEDVVQRISDSYVPWQENSFPGLLGNVAAGRIANRFDLGGTNCVVDAACASSLSAIHMASLELTAGRSDMAIAGGLDTFNDIFMYMCFSKTPALSPTGNSRPFALGGDGTILGEGMGAVILKRLDDAKRDGDKIYAVIKGIGTSSDGRGNAIYAPSAAGQVKALEDAYSQADVRPDSIELVEAHGTGTAVGDAVEADALEQVYRKANAEGTWCAIGSVKSMIGHTKSAAGVAGMIKTIMALKHKVLPPTIKVDQPLASLEPGKAPIYINTIKRPWVASESHPRRAALSAFGFGGSNFHCVLEEAEDNHAEIDWDGRVLLIALSADSKEDLAEQLNAIGDKQSWSEHRAFAASTCARFDAKKKHRLILVIEKDKTDFQTLIQNSCKMLAEETSKNFWQLPIGVTYASGEHKYKTGLLFPGQGTQYVGMLRDLACQFPQFNDVLNNANAVKGESKHGSRLTDTIYPIPVFNDAARQVQEETLRDTRNAQPAIGAVSLSGLRTLEGFGFKADITAGHSYGELVALCAAGVFDETALHQLSLLRGSLMAEGEGDRGSMLAVLAELDVVEKLIKDENLDLVIANHNAPKQIVLSGATNQIEKAIALCKQQKLRATQLPVSAAFHSKFVANAEAPFAEALAKIELHESTMSVLANTTADEYPNNQDEIRRLLAGQLANPVRFVEQIEKMVAEDVRTFVEVGPGNRLSGLVKAILSDKDDVSEFQILSLDTSSGKRHGQVDLANLLASLAVLDKDIDLTQWDAGYLDSLEAKEKQNASDKKPAMTIPLSGANYMKPREKRPARVPQAKLLAQAPIPQQTSLNSEMKNPVLNNTTATPSTPAVTTSIHGQDALRATQESILALQKMQEQTAKLHQQYLQGQETAQLTISQLLLQQQALLGLGTVNNPTIAPVQGATQVTTPVQTSQAPTKIPLAPEAPVTTSRSIEKNKPAAQIVEAGKAVHADEEVHSVLLEVVAEKTGYPLEMLSLDMSLDTDLGIDSIKRVEILSALQEKLPGAPTVNSEELGTFQFLQNIVEFIVAAMPKMAVTAPLAIAPGADSSSNNTAINTDLLASVLLEVVGDKTGYPMDMLNLDMSLDTDLGIDSIKRVEILSALQEKLPEAPMVSPEDLGNLQTLQQIVDFLAAGSVSAEQTTPSATVSADNEQLAEIMLEVVADKTGYPVDMLNLDMNLEADLGIDSIKRVEILSALQERMPELPAVKPEDLGTLQTLQQIVDHMLTSSPATTSEITSQESAAEVSPKINSEKQTTIATINRQVLSAVALTQPQDKISLQDNATIWVTVDTPAFTQAVCESIKAKGLTPKMVPLDAVTGEHGETLAGLIILTPAIPEQTFMKDSFMLVQRVSESLRAAGKSKAAILASVTQMGGQFGLHGVGETCPVSGGIAGLIKTADKEWPEVSCKAIDVQMSDNIKELADHIVDECLLAGQLEVGIANNERHTLELNTTEIDGNKTSGTLNTKDVVVVTGGARGVTAEIALALAETYHTNLLLLGRSEKPEPEAEWLTVLSTEAEIKKAILAKEGEGITPKVLNTACHKILADREIRNNLQRIESTGIKVIYRAVDVQDKTRVIAAVDEARRILGNIAGFVHGAGVLADKLIVDKTKEQFSKVYATKAAGLDSLLAATENDQLKIMIMFSSSTGRFGRQGQCDYAVANEVLNKVAQQQATLRKDCRVVSVNWGPWDGGMVTPALKRIFKSEGVGVIDLKAGADYLMQEIAHEGPVEVVVLGTTEIPEKSKQDINTKAVKIKALAEEIPAVNMQVSFSRTLNVKDHDFLQSHVINGHAVLPVAMMAEWLAHGAIHNNPGLNYLGFRNLRVFKGVTLEADETIDLDILAGNAHKDQDKDIVPVELRSGKVLHARAEIILTAGKIQQEAVSTQTIKGEYSQAINEIYSSNRLFHGELLQGITTINACSVKGISAQVKTSDTPTSWIKKPIRSSWLADPLALDSSFQMMILWCFEQSGVGSLPTAIGGYKQFQKTFPKDGCQININVIEHSEHRALATIEFIDQNEQLIARLDNYECVIDGSLEEAFGKNKLQVPSLN
jgi:acyl transferase domain-containing protein/NAD(P)-dependent dehydrogenase (short-subunit alcohol dehydrogenase family)